MIHGEFKVSFRVWSTSRSPWINHLRGRARVWRMPQTGLLDVPPQWVTLRTVTEQGLPIVVLVDQAIVTTAPYEVFTQQVAVAVIWTV